MENIEQVLVVPQAVIEPLLQKPYGTNIDEVVTAIIANQQFMDRPLAEVDPSFKQIIPYVVCRYDGLTYMTQRTKKQGEQRLHGKFSLGVGGHINPTDRGDDDDVNILESAMRRELREEVMMIHRDITPVGTIYIDHTDVGRVHVGLVYVLEAAHPKFEVMEPEQHALAKWATTTDIALVYDKLEDWGKIVFDRLIRT